VAVLAVALPRTPEAQVRPVYSRGAAGLLQLLERLGTTASALHTAAHPDDEDTAFIARAARGDHARVAYLSLNRGEGGQNVIGPELVDALGVIRTEELLQARALDGGDQFFTRTFDYGFSKTLAEAAEKWDERTVLGDMVRIIRQYRPLVIYAGFSGTPADGHGQHQFAGRLTPLAFKAAADPGEFPEQIAEGLRPWQAKKLYVRQGFRPDPARPASLTLATGHLDPVLGRSYFEIAMEGRSQHKSQEMGVPELKGPQASALRLVESLVAATPTESSVFDGLDTSIPGIAALAGLPAGSLASELATIEAAVKAALDEYDPRRPEAIVSHLARGLTAVRAARTAAAALPGASEASRAEADFLLSHEEREFEAALVVASGLVVDVLADRETVAPGEALGVSVKLFPAHPELVKVTRVAVIGPEGWTIVSGPVEAPDSGSLMARFFREAPAREEAFAVQVPGHAQATEPYWLTVDRKGDMFDWPDTPQRGLPFQPAWLQGQVEADIAGVPVTIRRDAQYRLVDQVRGELRRNVHIVPAMTLRFDSELEVVPLSQAGTTRRVVVRVQHHGMSPAAGEVRLRAPAGWKVEPAAQPFQFSRKGERTALGFDLSAPPDLAAGRVTLAAEAVAGDVTFTTSLQEIAYPHIQTHRLYKPAEATVLALDLAVAPVKVGYVMGSGDQVPDAIRRMGLEVTLLDEDVLSAGDLSRFDVIVVGIRASEARPDFVSANGRLLDFARRGGTLIVQYQQPDYLARNLAPWPGQMASRVTNERAPMTLLVPEHPLFTTPNRIGPADWEGWVQERNLYAFSSFDPRYQPLLETADPGEPAQQGGMLSTRLGEGHYIYTAYSWFRQLPAGVPGAYRLFANMLSAK
jgi:LmbE family N-acetylglucosaminyl deacetylase